MTDPKQPTASLPSTGWKNIASILLRNRQKVRELLTDDTTRIRIQFFFIYIILGTVSFGMTIVNIITHWHLLMLSTLFFGIANLINVGLTLIGPKPEQAARILFALEFLVLFTFFMVVGEPEGFSAIWSLLIPTAGMLLFRMAFGSILSLTQFAILIYLFWTPPGKSLLLFQYTDSFLLRFPLLYAAFFIVGFFLEFLRHNTQMTLSETRNQYEYLSNHDALTTLFNRYGFNHLMDEFLKENATQGFAFAIMDLDFFKNVNDTYGHQTGDMVLRQAAQDLRSIVGSSGIVCRWGGEEFAILFHDTESAERLSQQVLQNRRETRFTVDEYRFYVTASMGLLLVPPGIVPRVSEVVTKADENLYFCKQNGRNQLMATSLPG